MATKRGSTSSVRTVPSSRSQEVIDLGKRIINELGIYEGVDTLGKWMSHYLAESMKAAKEERDPARKLQLEDRCFKLIISIWVHRSHVPGIAKPTGRLQAAISALRKLQPDTSEFPAAVPYEEGEHTSPWFRFACRCHSLEEKSWAIAFLAGLLETDLGHERSWVADHRDLLDNDEIDLIEALDSWVASYNASWISGEKRSEVEGLPPGEREELLLQKIDESLQNQMEALETLKAELKERRQ